MASTWSDLPIDLLHIICSKLEDLRHYIWFGGVCRPWRSVLWLCRQNIPPQLPVLMIPNTSSGLDNRRTYDYRHSFFSIRNFNKDVLATREFIRCDCSSQGWLFERNYSSNGYQLLNPFLSANNLIQLPYLNALLILKVVISDNPTTTSNYVVMVLYKISGLIRDRRLAFFKSGDGSWSCIQNIQYDVEDIVFYKGQFYSINLRGKVVAYDISSSTQPKITRVASSPLSRRIGAFVLPFRKMYIVESSGDLLCIGRQHVADYSRYSLSVGFRVFKLQATVTAKWIELKSLKGHALYLGRNSSLSILASKINQCKPNHIYFADFQEMGVFNLEDARFQQLAPKELYRMRFGCIWIQPTLNLDESCLSGQPTKASPWEKFLANASPWEMFLATGNDGYTSNGKEEACDAEREASSDQYNEYWQEIRRYIEGDGDEYLSIQSDDCTSI